MLNRLVDLLVQFIGLFQCYTFIDEFEQAVVLRCGRYNRTVGPGLCWIVPLNFESVIAENVKPEPGAFDVQSLHSSDQYSVNIGVGCEYEIFDIRAHTLDFEDSYETNCIIAAGIVSDMVQNNKFDDIDNDLVKSLRAAINRKIKKRGGRFTELALSDLSNGSASRYWHEGIDLDFGED